jgi:hypothetical protein
VNNIEKVYTQWHELFLVLYQRNPDDKEIEYEIFSRGNIQVEYRTTIEQLYAGGNKILDPIFKEIEQDKLSHDNLAEGKFLIPINDEHIKAVEKLSVKLHSLDDDADSFTDSKNPSIKKEERRKLKQKLDQLKTQSKISEIIHTYEHRNYLFKALKEAKQRLMIVSPWITGYVVD